MRPPNLTTSLIAVLSVLLLVTWQCKSCDAKKYENTIQQLQKDCNKSKSDTTIQIIVPEQHPIQQEAPILAKEVKPTKQQIDSFISFVPVDTSDGEFWRDKYIELLSEWNTTRTYQDTAIFKNGVAITSSEVSQNRLRDQRTILDSIKANYTYVTNTKYVDKDRTQLYLGIAAFGDKTNLINAAGVEALLKLKSNIGIESGAYFNDKGTFYKAGFKFLIRLKNKHL